MVRLEQLLSSSPSEFEGVLRIYTEAHPASERKSADALAHMIARPEYLFLAAIEADAVVGFAIATAFADSDAALLEYMAVDASHRGRGLGRQMFRAVAEHALMAERFLLVEVDSDRTDSADAKDHARRMQFYRRLGCRQIKGLAYVMPKVSTAEPPLMDMLVYRPELPASIEKPHLQAWLESCYAQVYDQALPDERIATMLAGLPNLVPIQ